MSNNTYTLSYTGSEIDEKLGKIEKKADKTEIPSKISELKNDSNFMVSNEVLNEDGIIKQDILPEGYPYASILDFTTTLQANPENGESLITDKFELVSGNSYKVTWNGTEYTCTAQPLDFGSLIVAALGNLSIADENYENTNEPFIIVALPKEAAQEFGAYGTVMHLDGSTEANLSIYGNVTRKIDEKYLPDSDLKNMINGSAVGSVRGIFAAEETNGYTMGDYSHAEGLLTKASGNYSHAEGYLTEASGLATHAEGGSKASGDYSHAEGYATEASSYVSHAEGNGTKASGQNSHAEGVSTIAMYNQHVQGRYNIVDGTDYTSKYAHIVGNGTGVNERSNAHTLDWDGNAWFAGDVTIGEDEKVLATQEYVDDAVASVSGTGVLTGAQASAQLGNELIASEGWTATGWTGSFADGFTHTSGNTNPLSFAMPSGIAGKRYQVSFACTEEIETTTLKVRIGNSELFELYGQFQPDRWNGVGITAVEDAPLEFIPSSTFTGRIYDISLKEIVAPCEPYFEVQNKDGEIAFQTRIGDPTTYNLFLGTNSGKQITSGTSNVGVGWRTLENNTSGFWNVAIGSKTLRANDVGSRNVGIGYIALCENTTGNRNVAIGNFAMTHNTTGHHNIAIGADSMNDNTTGANNIGIGFGTLYSNTSATYNTALGYGAMHDNTIGTDNVAIGAMALMKNVSSSSSVAVGYEALLNAKGRDNTAVGNNAGSNFSLATSRKNTFIGSNAKCIDNVPNIEYSTAIGCEAKVEKSHQTVIGADYVTETLVKGNLVVRGTDGVKRQIVFNEDGTVGWVAV